MTTPLDDAMAMIDTALESCRVAAKIANDAIDERDQLRVIVESLREKIANQAETIDRLRAEREVKR